MSNGEPPPETASAWPLPPAHYLKASELEPPRLPPKDASSALPGEVPDPDFYKELVYDVPLDFHYSQQFESISEIISNLVPSEHLQHPKTALKFVNEAILVAFIRLVNSLATNPTQPAESHLENLNQYMMIFHQLLNAYRPHQARQMAISLLQAQCDRRKKFLEKLKERLEKSKEILALAQNNLASIDTKPPELASNSTHMTKIAIPSAKHSGDPPVDLMDTTK